MIEAISKNLGTGKTKSISLQEAALTNPDFDKFFIDIRMRPSKVFDVFEEEEGAQEGGEEEDQNASTKFKVHKKGKPRSMQFSVYFFYVV